MITANELVASRLTERKVPALYRIHEPPNPEGLVNVNFKLRTIDKTLQISSDADHLSPAVYAEVIERAEGLGLGELAHAQTPKCLLPLQPGKDHCSAFD